LIIAIYFYFISLFKITKKIPLKKSLKAYAFAFLKLLVGGLLLYILFKINVILFYFGFLLIFIPSITISRIIFYYFMNK